MKFHYKNPQEVREEYPGTPTKTPNPFRNRTFWMILADCALLLLIFGIMYKTGSLDSFFPSPTDLTIRADVIQSEERESPAIKVLLRNDADRTLNPGEENSSFQLRSAALRPGPIHSTDYSMTDQIELEIPGSLPAIWEVGRIAEFQFYAPEGKELLWKKVLKSEKGGILMLRFRNINREVEIVR